MGNKAMAGSASVTVAAQLTIIFLWALHLTPPQEVVVALQGVATAALTYLAVYFTPHNPAPPAEPSAPGGVIIPP